MKIQSYNVTMESSHTFMSTYTSSSTLKSVSHIPRILTTDKAPPSDLIRKATQDYLELSQEAVDKISTSSDGVSQLSLKDIKALDIPDKDKAKLLLLARMIKSLTGKDLLIVIPEKLDKITPDTFINSANPIKYFKPVVIEPQWAVHFSSSETYNESEALNFSAEGVIHTSDGKTINMNVNLNMSRSFTSQSNIDITMGNAKLLDPLVINFDRPAADLTNDSFSFDLDSDGHNETLSTLAKGSGYLALDLNNDGTINNGSELLGTTTNNGFEELKKYDTDKNNWIDESDPVFTKLKIWTVSGDGTKQLYSLADKGIGAIYLGNVNAGFGIHDNNNNLKAQATTAGIFVKEDGSSGTLQQIDYVV